MTSPSSKALPFDLLVKQYFSKADEETAARLPRTDPKFASARNDCYNSSLAMQQQRQGTAEFLECEKFAHLVFWGFNKGIAQSHYDDGTPAGSALFKQTKSDLSFRTHNEKNLAGKRDAIRPLHEAGKCQTVVIQGPALNEIPLIKSFAKVDRWIGLDNSLQTLRVFYENIPEKFRHKFDIVVEDETGLFQRVYQLYKQSNLSFEDFQKGIADLHNEVCNQTERDLPPTRLTGRATVWISSLVASQLHSYLNKFEALLSSSKYKKLYYEKASDQEKLAGVLNFRHLRSLATRACVVYFADTVSNKNFSRTLTIPMSIAHDVVKLAMQKARRDFTQDERTKAFAAYATEQFNQKGKNTKLAGSCDSTPIVKQCLQFFDCTSTRSWTWEKTDTPAKIEGDATRFSVTCERYVEQGVLEYILTSKEPKEEKGSKVETKIKNSNAGDSSTPESSESEVDLSSKADNKEGASLSTTPKKSKDEEALEHTSTTQRGSSVPSDEASATQNAKHLEAVAHLD